MAAPPWEAMFAGVAFRAWGRDQQDLVNRLKDNEVIRSESVERAFRLTDRALFVPYAANAQQQAAAAAAARAGVPAEQDEEADAHAAATHPLHMPRATAAELASAKEQSYMDAPVRVGLVHISAPHMYSLVLEKLGLQPGMSFLNLGSGSGWLSCMASVLVGQTGMSHGVELQAPVVAHARRCTATWRRRMRRWRRQQMEEAEMRNKKAEEGTRAAAVAAASSAASAAPVASSTKRKAEEGDAQGEGAKRSQWRMDAVTASAAGSHSDLDSEGEMHDDAAADSAATLQPPPAAIAALRGTPATAANAAAALPIGSSVVTVRGVGGGPSQRGVVGPSPDMGLRSGPGSGDPHAERAVRRSVMPVREFINSIYPREDEERQDEAAAEEEMESPPAPHRTDTAASLPQPSPSPPPPLDSPQPSPSPAPSMASSTGESASSEVGGPGSSWYPPFPVSVPCAPKYLHGDAFDLARDDHALRYDRIYIGAALPSRFIPTFAELLHPMGRLIAPFDDSFKMVSKRADGSIRVEHITSVGYAEMRLPPEGRDTSNIPRLAFAPPALNVSDDFAALPPSVRAAVHAIFMLQARDGSESLPGRLPLPLWMHVLSFASREWWLDRATGAVPWAVKPEHILLRAREHFQEGERKATARQWMEADARFEECTKVLTELRDELSLQGGAESTAASSAGSSSSSAASPSSSSSSGASDVAAAATALQDACWRRQLSVLRLLNRHSRAVRLCTDLLKLHPDDTAIMLAQARALTDDDELPHARQVLEQLEEKMAAMTAGASEDEEMADASTTATAPDSSSSAAAPPPIPLSTPVTPPSDLSSPSAASIASLRARIDAGMPSYLRRQRGMDRSFLAFMARLVAGDRAHAGADDDDEDEQEEDA